MRVIWTRLSGVKTSETNGDTKDNCTQSSNKDIRESLQITPSVLSELNGKVICQYALTLSPAWRLTTFESCDKSRFYWPVNQGIYRVCVLEHGPIKNQSSWKILDYMFNLSNLIRLPLTVKRKCDSAAVK